MYTPETGSRIAALLYYWKLTTSAAELIRRILEAGLEQALLSLLEVRELEAATRRERRVERLRRASKLPVGKSFDTLDRARVPRSALLRGLSEITSRS